MFEAPVCGPCQHTEGVGHTPGLGLLGVACWHLCWVSGCAPGSMLSAPHRLGLPGTPRIFHFKWRRPPRLPCSITQGGEALMEEVGGQGARRPICPRLLTDSHPSASVSLSVKRGQGAGTDAVCRTSIPAVSLEAQIKNLTSQAQVQPPRHVQRPVSRTRGTWARRWRSRLLPWRCQPAPRPAHLALQPLLPS